MSYIDHHPRYRELRVDDHLRLIEPQVAHAAASLSWVIADDVVQYMGADFSGPSLEGEERRLREIINNPDEYSWMIERDGTVIGNVCINSIADTSERFGITAGTLTILIGDKDAWGKGIATAVCRAVIAWAFTDAGFDALASRALQENAGSLRTLEKLGFQETGNEPYDGLVHGRQTFWRNFRLDHDQAMKIISGKNS